MTRQELEQVREKWAGLAELTETVRRLEDEIAEIYEKC